METAYAGVTVDRLSWVETDDAAITHNTRLLRAELGPHVALIGVAKADGYGHGAVRATRAMLAGGAAGLAVATVGEGRRLRAAAISAPILVLGYTPPEQIEEALRARLTLTIGARETLEAAARCAAALGRPVAAHLKVDSGMHRLGLLPQDLGAFLAAARELGGIDWQGIYTHLAVADEPWRPETRQQLDCFEDLLAAARGWGWEFPLVHAANSAGALCHRRARYGAVRAGIALYGVAPSDDVGLPAGFRPALSFHTRVVRVADLPPGRQVSYGGRYSTPGPRRIATIAVGYADGLRRSPPWREVLVLGRRAPIVGRICMDYAMIDVSATPEVAVGDTVTLLGRQGDAVIGAEEVATWLSTSAYEVLTTLARGEARL